MHILNKIDQWGKTHHPWWIDLFRGILGLILFLKGLYIIRNSNSIIANETNGDIIYASFVLIHFIAIFQISGGVAIMAGLMTRLTILLQIPIMICAVVIVNYPGKFNFAETENAMIILVFLFLFLILVEGSGKHSLDNYMRIYEKKILAKK